MFQLKSEVFHDFYIVYCVNKEEPFQIHPLGPKLAAFIFPSSGSCVKRETSVLQTGGAEARLRKHRISRLNA